MKQKKNQKKNEATYVMLDPITCWNMLYPDHWLESGKQQAVFPQDKKNIICLVNNLNCGYCILKQKKTKRFLHKTNKKKKQLSKSSLSQS